MIISDSVRFRFKTSRAARALGGAPLAGSCTVTGPFPLALLRCPLLRLAPEVCRDESYGVKVDVYSWAVATYEIYWRPAALPASRGCQCISHMSGEHRCWIRLMLF